MSRFKGIELSQFPGYEICQNGSVYSVSSNWRGYGCRELRQARNASGYKSVRLTVLGNRKRVATHKLVAMAFLPKKPESATEVRHLDGDKDNNQSTNLAWGTQKDNADDRERHGRTSRGLLHSIATKVGMALSGKTFGRPRAALDAATKGESQ